MARAGVGTEHELSCPACAAELNGHAPPQPASSSSDRCPHCGERLENSSGLRGRIVKRSAAHATSCPPGRDDAGLAELGASNSRKRVLAGDIRRMVGHVCLRRVRSGRPAVAPQ